MIRSSLLIVILLGVCCTQVVQVFGAQHQIRKIHPRNIQFSRITTEDGLSQAGINAILQDQRGYIWIGTQEGLNRFDGYELKIYDHRTEDDKSLSNDWVWSMSVDHQGDIWIATDDGGLNRLDPVQGVFQRYQHEPDNTASLASNRLRVVFVDASGMVWVGTDGAGLDRLDQDTGRFKHFKATDALGSLPGNTVLDVTQDSRGDIWVATDNGLAKLNGESFDVFRNEPGNPMSLSDNNVRKIREHRDGRLWIGTYAGGLNLFDTQSGIFSHFSNDPENESGLSNNIVRDILVDQNGSVWIATDDGLNEWRPKDHGFARYHHDSTTVKSLSDNRVNVLFQDRGGVLWIGTHDGLNRWNYISDAFVSYTAAAGYLNKDLVFAVSDSISGTLWVGTYGGGLNQLNIDSGTHVAYQHDADNPNSLADDRVMAVLLDSLHNVWVGTRGAGLDRFDPETGEFKHFVHDESDSNSLSSNGVTSLMEDKEGTLWIGTYGGGLNRLNPDTGQFQSYRHDLVSADSISSDRVLTVYQDRSGKIWVGTEDGGLNRLNRTTGNFERYLHDPLDDRSISSNTAWEIMESKDGSLWIGTLGGGVNRWFPEDRKNNVVAFKKYQKQHSLPSDTVFGILEDDDGLIWLSGNRGLSQLNPANGNVRHFDSRNGLHSDEFNFGARTRSHKGLLIFGGSQGLVALDPTQVKVNNHIPTVVISAETSQQQRQSNYSGQQQIVPLELDYTDYFVGFEFAALDYVSPDKNRYLYKLEGFDRDWQDPGSYRRATYTNLPQGDYEFRVIASNNDGIWNEDGASLSLVVIPPPWLSYWAYLVYITITGSIIYFYIQSQRRKLALEEAHGHMLEQQVQERTMELAQRNTQLEDLNIKLTEASTSDSLTGLRNRRYLNETMSTLVANIDRQLRESLKTGMDVQEIVSMSTLFVMMIDLDGFKRINDSYGHQAGDRALLRVSEILQGCTREADVLVRWGGDEFLIVGRGMTRWGVEHLAERIRDRLSANRYDLGEGNYGVLSGSIGFAPYPFSAHHPLLFSWEQVCTIADQAAYIAKEQGRNAWLGVYGTELTQAQDLENIKTSFNDLLMSKHLDMNMGSGGPVTFT